MSGKAYWQFQLLALLYALLAIGLSVAVTHLMSVWSGLQWPWCGFPGGMVALCLYDTVLWTYAAWYDDLPE